MPSRCASRSERQNLLGDVDRTRSRKRSVALDGRLEGDPLDQLHHDEVEALALAVVEHGHGVRVAELGDRRGLEEEALAELRVLVLLVLRAQDLDGDEAAEGGLLRLVDGPHTSAGDRRDDAKPIVNDLADERIAGVGALVRVHEHRSVQRLRPGSGRDPWSPRDEPTPGVECAWDCIPSPPCINVAAGRERVTRSPADKGSGRSARAPTRWAGARRVRVRPRATRRTPCSRTGARASGRGPAKPPGRRPSAGRRAGWR